MSASPLVAKLTALQARVPRGMLLGLDRVEHALAALGSPHLGLRAVHVAGSNGKGSTSAMIEAIARAAGLRTGLYTSPHLCRFAERIRLGGEPIDDVSFERSLAAVLDHCRPDLTFFESLTVAAFHAFREARVDLAVLEVGLGGRLDATNVIPAPLATAVTSIALEHTAILGDTIALIAREKAGILKPGAPVVLGPLAPEADEAIAEVAARVGAGPIYRVQRDGAWTPGVIRARWDGGVTDLHGPTDADRFHGTPALLGGHQADNAGVALGVARCLAAHHLLLDPVGATFVGLTTARWPGRYERIAIEAETEAAQVTVILDGAHNPEGALRLAELIAAENPSGDPARRALVFGALADKRWTDMLAPLAPLAARRYYTEPKGRAPADLADLRAFAPGEGVADPREAINRAVAESRPGDTVLVTGSIYLVGEIRAHLLGIAADPVIAL
jgi:dihydrofolate synthase/folylpolyglutamate synthase